MAGKQGYHSPIVPFRPFHLSVLDSWVKPFKGVMSAAILEDGYKQAIKDARLREVQRRKMIEEQQICFDAEKSKARKASKQRHRNEFSRRLCSAIDSEIYKMTYDGFRPTVIKIDLNNYPSLDSDAAYTDDDDHVDDREVTVPPARFDLHYQYFCGDCADVSASSSAHSEPFNSIVDHYDSRGFTLSVVWRHEGSGEQKFAFVDGFNLVPHKTPEPAVAPEVETSNKVRNVLMFGSLFTIVTMIGYVVLV